VVSATQTATGLAFAAFFNPDAVQSCVDDELAHAALEGGPDRDSLLEQIAETRLHGLARSVGDALSEQHQAKLNAFSAPVFNARGEMVLAITAINRADLLDPCWDGPTPVALLTAARNLSHALGYKQPAAEMN